MITVGEARTKPVRVVIVDDSEDIRFLLRMQFSKDQRFEVVGEAADGHQAVVVAEEHKPDLVILDQQMPERTGLEAIADIRACSPEAAIILYTAHTDRGVYQAAFDAGALEVLEKVALGGDFVDYLVGLLIDHAAEGDAAMEIRVGPVASAAARVWIANTRRILEAVFAHPEIVGTTIPEDVAELFWSFLRQWEAVARSSEEFRWVARSTPEDVQRVVGYWAEIDAMTDEQLEQLGITWAPPEGMPFFEALTSGVLEALRRHEETRRLAAHLGERWADYLGDR